MPCHTACPPCPECEELRRRVAELEGALLGLLSRDDFWRAVQLRAAYEVTQRWAGTGLAQNEWGVALVNALQALSSPAAGGEKP